jgi:DNA-directed RNA polymerase subunit RPC12/RpoP
MQPQQINNRCTNCGAPLPAGTDAYNCTYCGQQKIRTSTRKPQPTEEKKAAYVPVKTNLPKYLLAIAVLYITLMFFDKNSTAYSLLNGIVNIMLVAAFFSAIYYGYQKAKQRQTP